MLACRSVVHSKCAQVALKKKRNNVAAIARSHESNLKYVRIIMRRFAEDDVAIGYHQDVRWKIHKAAQCRLEKGGLNAIWSEYLETVSAT